MENFTAAIARIASTMRQEKQTATAERTAITMDITIIRQSVKVVCPMKEDEK